MHYVTERDREMKTDKAYLQEKHGKKSNAMDVDQQNAGFGFWFPTYSFCRCVSVLQILRLNYFINSL